MNNLPTDNIDKQVVSAFGEEWQRFDQQHLTEPTLQAIFDDYFHIFPWSSLPADAKGFDLGCGSGRWARFVAPRVGQLHCIDPSSAALAVTQRNLHDQQNCQFHLASVDQIPLGEATQDFGYSLGVLHHVPDTLAGLKACTHKLRPGAPFLLYLYYAFDGKPWWFRVVWKLSDVARTIISRMPTSLKHLTADVIACTIYWPLSRLSKLVEKMGLPVENIPLSFYRHKSFYVLRTDALDRFGTRLEKRFSKAQIQQMMTAADLEKIVFSDRRPFWCAVGYKRALG
ncbi:MAG: class I SAM-dependent methyltransferase [Betaproteobacteria bacterium]|nr:class I SAM-dependent methyltransferase [Betaproteobacteria bacterium]